MSWVGHIVSTSINTINSQVGYSGTAQTSFNDDRVRRLSNKTTSSSLIQMSDMRFGLQLPLISYTDSFFANTVYQGAQETAQDSASAASYVELSSNGSGYYFTVDGNFGTVINKSFTWLTSGSAGDYTCEMIKQAGDTPAGSPVNTSLSLVGTRYWETSAVNFTPGSLLESNFTGTLFIKKGGVTGPYRKFELSAAAQVTS